MATRTLASAAGFALVLGALLHSSSAPAHSGGTNADGCHTNRQTGDYHCHDSKPSNPSDDTYCHIVSGERRCGYSRSSCNELVSTYGGYCREQ